MWRFERDPPMDVAKSWADEEALSRRRRRERYRCGDDFVTLKALLPWTVQLTAQFPDAHNPPAPVPAAAAAAAESTAASDAATSVDAQPAATAPAPVTRSATEDLTEQMKNLTIDSSAPALTGSKSSEAVADVVASATSDALPEAESKPAEPAVVEIRSKPKDIYEPNAEINRKITIWQGDSALALLR